MTIETYKYGIELINAISLGLFGIGVTIFTILYAFILDKKEKVEFLLKQQQDRRITIFEERQLNFSRNIMNKYKKIAKLMKFQITLSFLIFICTTYLIFFNKVNSAAYQIFVVLLSILLIFIIYILYRFNRRYNRDMIFR